MSYSAAMATSEPHIVLTLDTKEPIELTTFVGAFVALGNEYDRFIKSSNPNLIGKSQIHVREVRAGSIQADLIPWITVFAPLISDMDKALIVEQFVRVWGGRFVALFRDNGIAAIDSRSELRDWANAVQAIANDPQGSAKLEATVFEDGKKKIRAAMKFSTPEARDARNRIELRQRELERRDYSDYSRVLMRFTRSDIGNVKVGQPSAERVFIEELSERPLALIYGSALAEERLKHEIREADENVYKKGFVVDVNVRSSGGKPVGYAVTHVHQVIDLPED
jgi:hypothetical protein